MIRIILGLALIVAGIWIFHAGWSRKDSLMGSLSETGTKIANAFDGGSRTPKHYLYLGGGAILAVGGGFLLVASRRKG